MKKEIKKSKSVNAWYRTPLGKSLLSLELKSLTKVLPNFFGYYIALIGGPNTILASSKINNRMIINPSSKLTKDDTAIKCDLDSLPFLPKSIDVIVLFHVLETAENPLKLLSEIHSSLIDGGHLIVIGFNPRSVWGITRIFKNLKYSIWKGRWLTPKKLSSILLHTGFGVGDYQTTYFRPPFKNPNRMKFLEKIGRIFWPTCGASYIYVAEKTSPVLIPIKKLKSILKLSKLAKGLVKPTSRSIHEQRQNTIDQSSNIY